MPRLCTYDERKILLQIAEGDERAFRLFFEEYHQLLGSHIMRITRSRELTEEIVQDVFMKIWMVKETLAEVRDLRAYLYMVSKNHALNSLKRIARQREIYSIEDWSLVERASPSRESDSQDYYCLIDEAIDRLPAQQRKVYLLSRRERMKYDEIAHHLGLSRETVKKYLQIATESITSFLVKKVAVSVLSLCFIFF